ncbi:MAG: hypothetical protein ACT4N8_07265 [Sphingosinicella sp.]|uniref:hypothetical protein n=1 Tax=Sphingosinicella sp. TaxID=1917971 RepID=UPI004037A87B
MARARVLQNVFKGGELSLKKDDFVELEDTVLATHLRRGNVEPAKAEPTKPAKEAGEKGKAAK